MLDYSPIAEMRAEYEERLALWDRRVKQLEEENAKLRKENADAAALRQAFAEASNAYGRIREGRTAARPRNWKPSREDEEDMACWDLMYEAIRDSQAGLTILKELATVEGAAGQSLAKIKEKTSPVLGEIRTLLTAALSKEKP